MNNLIARIIFGSLYVLLVLVSVLVHQALFIVVFLVLMMMTIREFNTKTIVEKKPIVHILSYGTALAIYAVVSLVSLKLIPPIALISLLLLPGMIFMGELLSTSKNPLIVSGRVFMTLLYIALPFSLMTMMFDPVLNFDNPVPDLLLFVFIIIWMNDSAAYLIGKTIGKHQLSKYISPGKTWEGTIGGIILSILTAYILSGYFPILNPYQWLMAATLVSVCSILGDLCESLIKRSLGIKDFGNIIPGHGGLLDRFDSILFTLPFIYLYFFLIFS